MGPTGPCWGSGRGPALHQEEEEQQEQQNLENDQLEAEKKTPKMNDFKEAIMVGNYIAPRPSQYALRRLENSEYLELWYLIQERCADTAEWQLTQNDDTSGLPPLPGAGASKLARCP